MEKSKNSSIPIQVKPLDNFKGSLPSYETEGSSGF